MLPLGAGLLSAVVIADTASAADIAAGPYTKAPPMSEAVYDWTGFYIGANAGGGSSHGCWGLTNVAGVALPTTANEGCNTGTGAIVGGQVGYRWQAGTWVFGVEAQGDWADFSGSNSSLTAIIPYTNQTKVEALGLFTGQIGYAWNNALLYVKGGAAVADDEYSSFFPVGNVFAAAGVPFNSASETRWGGAVGAGVEHGFAPNWSVAVEYDHLFMRSSNVVFAPTNIAVGRLDNVSQDIDIGTIRLNYRFGGPVLAKY